MKLKFLTDFRGVETHEAFYLAGEEAEVGIEMAQLLIQNGRAEAVNEIEAVQPELAVEPPAKAATFGKREGTPASPPNPNSQKPGTRERGTKRRSK